MVHLLVVQKVVYLVDLLVVKKDVKMAGKWALMLADLMVGHLVYLLAGKWALMLVDLLVDSKDPKMVVKMVVKMVGKLAE